MVFALCVGTFARSLSFVISPEYVYDEQDPDNAVADYVHVCLRVVKDICFVQSFVLVVVFWLELLGTVSGELLSQITLLFYILNMRV